MMMPEGSMNHEKNMNDQESKHSKNVNYAKHLNLGFSQMMLFKDVWAVFE